MPTNKINRISRVFFFKLQFYVYAYLKSKLNYQSTPYTIKKKLYYLFSFIVKLLLDFIVQVMC